MTFVSARMRAFELHFRRPLLTARGRVQQRRGVLLRLTDGAGNHGFGEAAPLPGWSATVPAALDAQARRLVEDVAAGAAIDPSALVPELAAGFDLACADLAARQAGVPLWRHLGATETSIAVNTIVSGDRPDEVAIAATQALHAGFTVLKVKAGLADDLDRVRAISWATGGEATLRLDANRAWSPADAEAVANLLASGDLPVEYLEDPVADLDTLAAVRADLPLPVAVDELVGTAADLERVIDEGLAEVIVVKPAISGGIVGTTEVARRAAPAGIDIVVSSTYDAAVGVSGWSALAAAIGGQRAHGLATSLLLADDVAPAPAVRRGRLQLSDRPGLGIDPDMAPQ